MPGFKSLSHYPNRTVIFAVPEFGKEISQLELTCLAGKPGGRQPVQWEHWSAYQIKSGIQATEITL